MGTAWRNVDCERCWGYGVIGYGPDQRAEECSDCQVAGILWISRSGHITRYPGAPFMGSATATERANSRPADNIPYEKEG